MRPADALRQASTYAAAPQGRIVLVGYPNIISTGPTAPLHCPTVAPGSLPPSNATGTAVDDARRRYVASPPP
jgi:hypothetical protein